LDALAILREFGPALAGVVVVVSTLAGVIRYQNTEA
jgi:hypothetical protein